jgi:hypothetical protein
MQRARSNHQGRLINGPVDPVQQVCDEKAWRLWESAEPARPEHDDLDRLHADRVSGRLYRRTRDAQPDQPDQPGRKPAPTRPVKARITPAASRQERPASWRQRASQALDRLADSEVRRGAKLERTLIPIHGHSDQQ